MAAGLHSPHLLLLLLLLLCVYTLQKKGFFLQQYLASEDADLISEEETATFLTRLKQALQANTEGPDGQDDDDDDSMEIAPFVRVARDILNYLRFNRSGALLALLRQFARSGTITVADVSPDELQTEVARLLNITTLDNWYMHSSSRAGPELRTLPPPVPTPGDGSTSQVWRGGQVEELMGGQVEELMGG